MIGDLLGGLQKMVEWRRIVELSDKVPDLERRIALLESRIGSGNASHHTPCPSCGVGAWRKKSSKPTAGSFGELGALDITYGCNACSYTETKMEG